MNRFKTAAAAFLIASFVGLQPAAAFADGTQRRHDDQRDRREEQRDRREEQRDRREGATIAGMRAEAPGIRSRITATTTVATAAAG
jgi:hypothetical protein